VAYTRLSLAAGTLAGAFLAGDQHAPGVRTRLLRLLIVGFALFSTVVVALSFNFLLRERLLDETLGRYRSEAEKIGSDVAAYLARLDQQARALAAPGLFAALAYHSGQAEGLAALPHRFLLEDFRSVAFFTAGGQVLRAGGEVHLSPKAFDLLSMLVLNQSQAMAKADLHARLWPDTFVMESNLAGLVAEIRRALGDAADRPRFIRTVPRFGYWFVGTVSQVDGGPDSAADATVRYWLVWEARQISLDTGDNIVGRAPDATIWIEAPGVSRHHARIRLSGGAATLEDLRSKNGTYVGGQRVSAPRLLVDGDQIRIGSIVMTFRIPPPAGSTGSVES